MKKYRSNSIYIRTTRSMQYYRIWIYSCNGILGITSAIFAIFAAFILADVRLSLLGGVELYHPTFLYAYTALILQCGVVQTIGCLGAQRLSHKLLSVYWILLLLLTIGDVVVGLVWVFKLDKVKLNLRPVLTREFISKYSTDESFTKTWNLVQTEEHCCGVDGPLDYDKLSRAASQHSKNPNSSLVIDVESSFLSLPESCCIVIHDSSPISGGSSILNNINQTYRSSYHPNEKEFSGPSNRSDFKNDDRRDWDDRGKNVTNLTNSVGSGSHGTSIFPWENDGSDGSGRNNEYMFNDENNSNPNQLTDTIEIEYYDGSQPILHSSSSNIDKNVHSTKNESFEEPNLPLTSNLVKHKVRHGIHRWKQTFQQNDTSSNLEDFLSSVSYTENDISVEESKDLPSNKNVSNERRNKTKSLLPSFSHVPKRPSKTKTTIVTTKEPELAEKLPVPFTCHKHLRIHYKNLVHPNDNKESSYTTSNSKTDVSMDDDGSREGVGAIPKITDSLVGSTTEETNEIGESYTTESKNNDETQFKRIEKSNPEIVSSFQRRKRNKRNSSVNLEDHTLEKHLPPPQVILGSNPFNFLYASAFTQEANDASLKDRKRQRKRSSDGIGESTPITASDIQAAYYFSSSSYYKSNSFNSSSLEKKFQVYRLGCGVKLIEWVDHVSGILFILGFCIIGFIKASFLIILRKEIKEMIEKIEILELDDPVSPSRAYNKDQRLSYVSHPLLAHPHRASTVSAHAFNVGQILPTIKSPEGLSSNPTRFTKSYQQRRQSSYIVGERSQTHSQETVNMTVLVTNTSGSRNEVDNSKQTEKGRSNPNISLCGGGTNFMMMGYGRGEEFDPALSISVPNTSRYLRRSSTCSSSANPGQSYTLFSHYDYDQKPGPSSRFYHYEPNPHHYSSHHQHCHHYTRARPHIRNISTGAVVHQNTITNTNNSSGTGGTNSGYGGTSSFGAFRSFGGESGSGGCSFSSRDENEILSASMENVEDQSDAQQKSQSQSEDDKEKERREAEIRDWAAATACTDNRIVKKTSDTASKSVAVSLGDYTKAGFNHSSDSAESNDRTQNTKRNGNNNMEPDSIPLSYLGTAV